MRFFSDDEQIIILRDQVNDLDDILRDRQAELRTLDASAAAANARTDRPPRDPRRTEIERFAAQKKELSRPAHERTRRILKPTATNSHKFPHKNA